MCAVLVVSYAGSAAYAWWMEAQRRLTHGHVSSLQSSPLHSAVARPIEATKASMMTTSIVVASGWWAATPATGASGWPQEMPTACFVVHNRGSRVAPRGRR